MYLICLVPYGGCPGLAPWPARPVALNTSPLACQPSPVPLLAVLCPTATCSCQCSPSLNAQAFLPACQMTPWRLPSPASSQANSLSPAGLFHPPFLSPRGSSLPRHPQLPTLAACLLSVTVPSFRCTLSQAPWPCPHGLPALRA
jgi:hypothetical protein